MDLLLRNIIVLLCGEVDERVKLLTGRTYSVISRPD
jgi:hypothetical protein